MENRRVNLHEIEPYDDEDRKHKDDDYNIE